ncbi:MAG: carboxypeptidase regulatory-like domain-containing protein [Pyrinomonadaceae bacterium]
MKRIVIGMVGPILVLVFCQALVYSQTTGSIAGTVVDANGAAVPAATVVIRGGGGQEFTVVTNDSGSYRVPSVASGVYSVTTTAPSFKRSVVEDVKVDVGLPTTVNVTLQAGEVSETVVVTGGGEVLQTQTATVGTTITGRQIVETPIASRDALDLVTLLPGTASVGAPRRSSINGLPKGSIAISIDGVDVQDNLLRSSDGFFTYVRPRVDAIEEVTVSTSNPGAEASGDGAVQIKFVTKRGTNDYKGSLFWQHRDESLNANYWYQNRDGQRDENGEAYRQKIRLNQYGGSFGGPIPFPRFGDGGGPLFDSGKDKLFFFVNYEEFRIPQALSRTRVILTPEAQAGIFSYTVGTSIQSVDLLQIAANAGRISTVDPTIGSLLSQIRSATATQGTITPRSGTPNYLNYNFSPTGDSTRKFLVLRFDANLGKNHSAEFVTNQQEFVPSKDFLNSQDERFPGMPFYTQGSVRDSYSGAVRSNFGTNLINEARVAISTGLSTFSAGISPADYAYQGGYNLNINPTGVPITTATSRNSYSDRNTPTYDFTENATWIKGSHSIGFGGQYKLIRREGSAIGRIVPSVSFGLDSTDPDFSIFDGIVPTANLTEARNLYAMLIGRVTTYFTNAYLTEDGTYKENASSSQLAKQKTYGLYIQDSWKARPNLLLNFGVRWQPQTAFRVYSPTYSRVDKFEDAWGVSGFGNIFKPGTLTGRVPFVVPTQPGEKAYNDDLNNFAPTFGFAWTPDLGKGKFLRGLFGANGKSVFRGGYSVAFVREGFNLLESILGSNPGGSLTLTRSLTSSNPDLRLTVGTNLRDPNNPNLTTPNFPTSPQYPLTLTSADSTNVFDPNIKTGSVHSFSFGLQRELDKNTVVEFRYVGNRGIDLQRQYNINEFNTIENGFAAEFLLAQQNLYANIANGFASRGFAYRGPNTGTSPLPIMLSYFNSAANYDPMNPARYLSTNFNNSTLVTALSVNAPNIFAFSGTSFEDSATRRNNAIANGRPINFFYVNPTTGVNGSFIIDNSQKTWYDSGVIEVRRRMSQGLRVGASYVWSKAQSDAFQSSSVVFSGFTQREGGLELAKNVQAFDIRHQFKLDATYDLPFGRGKQFFSSANGFVNALVGGFTILPVIRWQSGSPISFGNVQLVGMDKKELQKMIGVYKNSVIDGVQVVTYLPEDIINNTRKAFNISVANTNSNGGYGTTFGTGGPQGKFIAPAGYGNCIARFAGECGFNNLILYGPTYFKLDATVTKRFMIGERRSIDLSATFLDALNMPNFRVGGFGADTSSVTVGGATFGQLGNGSAYQDISTTNDNGGRQIDLKLRINF